jgi:hypothetical protein
MPTLCSLAAWWTLAMWAPNEGFNVLREALRDPSVIFQKDGWSQIMNGVRIALTLGGALLLVYEARARRLGQPVAARTQRRVAMVMTVLAFSAYFDFYNPNARYSQYYHRHEFFHYYLGSKYSAELGYNRIYECTAAAEIELGRRSEVMGRELRDLRENLTKPVTDPTVQKHIGACRPRFTDARWSAFKQDVGWFQREMAGSYWDSAQKDHGYNPPPVWTMAGKLFGSFAPAGDGFFKLLSAIDVLFQLGAVLLIRWAFGWRTMAIATVFWGCNAPANFYWTGGAFLRQDWFFLLVAALCLAKKRYFALAGAALTWSALLRVFPVISFAGWGAVMLFTVLGRLRRGQGAWLRREHKRVILGSLVLALVLVPVSVAVTGPGAYREFVEHTLRVHKTTPLTNHMGLETMLAHGWEGRIRFTRDDNLDDPFRKWKEGRVARFQSLKPLYFTVIAAVGLWTLWALRRTKLLWVALPLGLPLTVCLTNLTCYYYSMFILGAALVRVRPPLGPVYVAASGASQILLLGAPVAFYFMDDRYTAESWLYFLLGALFLFSYSRPFSVRRLKDWFYGRRELAPATVTPGSD